MPQQDWIWQKERLLNILLDRLPKRITKVAWLDADLLFLNSDWARLASESLETWAAIQLFDYVRIWGRMIPTLFGLTAIA